MNESQFKQLSKKEQLNSTLDGIAYWAFVSKPKVSEKYKTTTFTLNLGLDAENQRKAESLGLTVKPADKSVPMPYVVINRKVKPGIEPETVKPELVNKAQQAITDLVGNGSSVRVKFGRYWFPNNGGGVGTVLFKVQVINLIKFDGSKDRDLIFDETDTTGSVGSDFDLDDFLSDDTAVA